MPLGWNRPTNCCCTNSVPVVLGLIARACRQPGCQRHLYSQVQLNMRAQFLKKQPNPRLATWDCPAVHIPTHTVCCVHHQIAGFNETVRNWHGEWYFTRSSRGIGIQFSTSNNTTSLNDHWLVYRHCAKLRDWVKVEKTVLPNRQTTTLSPISPLFVCNFSAQLWKCWKKTGINRSSAKCKKDQSSLDFPSKCRVAKDQTWSSFQVQGWCHLSGLGQDFLMLQLDG